MKKELVTSRMVIEDKEIVVDGYVCYYVETNYGADADGGRGDSRTWVHEVQDIIAVDLDGDDVFLTNNHRDLAAETLTRKFLEGSR